MPHLATDLLLLGRSPTTGRLRNRAALEKGLRAALFVELIEAGRIGDSANSPLALTADQLDDRVLDTVLATVAAKPHIVWRRWYRHVAADRVVLTRALIADGRWTRERDPFGRTRFRDDDQNASLALAHAITSVAERRQDPANSDQAALALLATMCGAIVGRPRPRDLRGPLAALLDSIGPPSDPVRRDISAALNGCAAAIRHRTRILA